MLLGEAQTPAGMRIYAIGDIHGCIRQLENLFAIIDHDLSVHPSDAHQIVTIGDYVDRGPDSKAAIEFLLNNRKTRPMVCLRGNHDQRMLEFMDIPEEVGDAFMTYGGRELLQSYDVDPDATDDLVALSRAFRRNVPASHVRFLDGLALCHEAGDYYFCHAGIRPGVALQDQQADDLLWIRNAFLNHQGAYPKVIIHGHTPRDQIDIQPNRINVDSCCFDTGRLSSIVLEGNSWRELSAS